MLKPKETSPEKEKQIDEQNIKNPAVKKEIFEDGEVPAKTDEDMKKESNNAPDHSLDD